MDSICEELKRKQSLAKGKLTEIQRILNEDSSKIYDSLTGFDSDLPENDKVWDWIEKEIEDKVNELESLVTSKLKDEFI